MKPTRFDGWNTNFAENQPEYLALPAHRSVTGIITSCWQLTWRERLRVLFKGVVWQQTLTFNRPLQPQMLAATKPELEA